MIVQCEQCMAKYRLDESRIPGQKGKVKCSKCQHVFLVAKEHQSRPEQAVPLSLEEEPQKSTHHSFQCPNCGFQQPPSEECIKCGIIFRKYRERAEATPPPYPPYVARYGLGRHLLHDQAEERSMEYAGFWVRFAACFIDGIVTGIMVKIAIYVAMFPIAYSLSLNPQPASIPPSLPVALVVSALVCITLPTLYYVLMWGRRGATLGKMAMKIKIVGTNGSDISYGTAFLRYIGTMVSYIPFCLGYLWMLWDDKNQTWHDKIASTYVIRTR